MVKKTIEKKEELDKFLDEKLGELGFSKELKYINKDDLLVSYDFNSLHISAQRDINSTWPKIETAYPIGKNIISLICSLFNSGKWNELNRLNRSAFLIVKYHNTENVVFQHLSVKEKTKNPYKNIRLEETNRMRNGEVLDTLTSGDIV